MREKNKVYPYVVVLKQNNRRSVELIGIILGALALLMVVQRTITRPGDWIFGVLMAVALGGLLFYNIQQFRKRRKLEALPLYFLVAIALGLTMFGVAYFIIGLLYHWALKPVQLGFSETGIVFDTLVRKRVLWTELNNAMIKDGIITLDYKNNKLFQKETDDDDSNDDYDVSEEEFNAYCRAQLKLAGQFPVQTN